VTSASAFAGALEDAEALPEEEALDEPEPEPLDEPEPEPLDELAEPTSRTDAPSSPQEAATKANAKTSPNNLSKDERFMFGISVNTLEGE
tara:strand:+ start:88 stop:357 length:270 start_codon:yes stop_codon:yes gene_type:complete